MPERVRAMVLEAFGQPLQAKEFPLPSLAPGALLLRVRAAGVCGSDQDIIAGQDPRTPLPLIPGHEALGEVLAVGEGKADVFGAPVSVGQLVAFGRGLTCGRCQYCTVARKPALCRRRTTYGISLSCAEPPHLNGCYAEVLYVRPESEVFILPPEADPVGLVAATCSGATAAHAVELAEVALGDLVVVIGPGPLGLYAAALARDRGAREVVMIGTGRNPLALARAEEDGCVAVSMASATAGERQELVRGLGHGLGAEVVLDCAGTAASLGEALQLVAPGGTVAFPGVAAPLGETGVDPYHLARNQIRLQGVWVSEPRHLWQALQAGMSGRHPLRRMVTHVLPLARANEAAKLLRRKQALKVVLVPEQNK